MILTPEEIQSRISLFCLFLVKALVSHLTLQLQTNTDITYKYGRIMYK